MPRKSRTRDNDEKYEFEYPLNKDSAPAKSIETQTYAPIIPDNLQKLDREFTDYVVAEVEKAVKSGNYSPVYALIKDFVGNAAATERLFLFLRKLFIFVSNNRLFVYEEPNETLDRLNDLKRESFSLFQLKQDVVFKAETLVRELKYYSPEAASEIWPRILFTNSLIELTARLFPITRKDGIYCINTKYAAMNNASSFEELCLSRSAFRDIEALINDSVSYKEYYSDGVSVVLPRTDAPYSHADDDVNEYMTFGNKYLGAQYIDKFQICCELEKRFWEYSNSEASLHFGIGFVVQKVDTHVNDRAYSYPDGCFLFTGKAEIRTTENDQTGELMPIHLSLPARLKFNAHEFKEITGADSIPDMPPLELNDPLDLWLSSERDIEAVLEKAVDILQKKCPQGFEKIRFSPTIAIYRDPTEDEKKRTFCPSWFRPRVGNKPDDRYYESASQYLKKDWNGIDPLDDFPGFKDFLAHRLAGSDWRRKEYKALPLKSNDDGDADEE